MKVVQALAASNISFHTEGRTLEIHCHDCDVPTRMTWDEVEELTAWLTLWLKERASL